MALFFALRRFLNAFCASCCVCCRSGPVLVGLGALRTRFWRVPGEFGEGFGGPKAFFFYVFSHTRACNAKKLRICKKHSFSHVFYKSQATRTRQKTIHNPFRNLARSTSQQDHAQNLSWVSPASLLEGSGALLGRLLAALGRLLALLGRFLGGSWPLLGHSWASLGWSGSFPVCILAPLDAPGLDFGGFGALPG